MSAAKESFLKKTGMKNTSLQQQRGVLLESKTDYRLARISL